MRVTRSLIALVVVALVMALGVAPAGAHVTIPEPAVKGGFSTVTLKVPNERPDASTVKIEVKLPESHPLTFVSVQPKPGWTVETTTRTLDEPVEAFGEEVTEVVDTVTWTGGEIGPGEFDTFALSAGVLPDDVDQLVFPTIQTYNGPDAEEVAWIEEATEGEEEPEHPAPVLTLVDDPTSTAAEPAADDEDETDPLTIAALAVALLAAGLGAAALVTARRS